MCCAAPQGGRALLGAARRGGAIVPIQAHVSCHLLNDPQIRFGLTRRINRLLAQLHHPVGVGHRAGFFGPGGGRQHHIGQPGGFGHENVLHHQMFQTRQRVARMVQVGVAHGRVLAHDVHAANLVRVALGRHYLVHDLDHGVAGLVIQLCIPKVFKPGMRGLVRHTLVVGEHHGDQSRVAGALHVVLTTQRVQASAGLADLPRHGTQRNQTARVVGAMHVLANAHAPQNHRAFGLGEFTRHFTQGFCRNTADRRHGLGAVALDVFSQGFVIVHPLVDEVLIHQPFVNDRVNQRVEHGHVGVGLELQRAPGMLADVGDARVRQHNFCAVLRSIFHKGGGHRMVGCRIGADHKDHVGVRHVIDLVAYCPGTHTFEQRCHAGGMAQPRAMVHIVGAKAGAHQLLEQVGLFIAALGATKACECFFAVRITQAFELARRQRQRFFPARFTKHLRPVGGIAVESLQGFGVFGHTGLADQRHAQALRAVCIVKAKAALDAQP